MSEIPVLPEGGLSGHMIQLPGGASFGTALLRATEGSGGVLTNDDLADPHAKIRFLQATGPGVQTLRDLEGKDLQARLVWVEAVEMELEDGEVNRYLRVTFMSPAGEFFRSSSKVVAHQVERMLTARGNLDPWEPPYTFKVVKKPAPGGVAYHVLELTGLNGKESRGDAEVAEKKRK